MLSIGRLALVLGAGLLASGCATAGSEPPRKMVKYSKADIAKRCAAHGQAAFARGKARGPVVYGIVTGVATLADPDWFAKAVRDKAIQNCLDAGGNV
jgi:hypothetical protein